MDTSGADTSVPVTPAAFHILLVLADHDAHGYAIMQEVERLTDGKVRLGAGTLYRTVYKLVLDGAVEELKQVPRPVDERRITYRITRAGLAVARAEAQRLDLLVKVARGAGLLDDKPKRPSRARARSGL